MTAAAPSANGKPKIVATFPYHGPRGELLYQVVRQEPGRDGQKKEFPVRRPDGKGGWAWGLGGISPVLYRLPELLKADKGRPACIFEGEGKADRAATLGLVSTCNLGGAGKWKTEYAEALRDRHVLLFGDNDEAGRNHVKDVATKLRGVAASIKAITLPGLPPKGDIIDWLAIGGNDKVKLLELVQETPDYVHPEDGKPSSESTQWQPPLPLGTVPPAEPFPAGIFPSKAWRFLEEVAWALNCPVDFAAVSALVIAGGAIGNAKQLSVTRTHRQSACLFANFIARPGTLKSPCLRYVKGPLEAAERRWRREWQAAMKKWKEAGKADGEERGPKPVLRRALADNFTVEALAPLLLDNRKGITVVKSELVDIVSSLNQYKPGGRGSDRQALLQLWDGETIRIDRKKNAEDAPPIYVPEPFMAIIGGMQPSVFQQFRGESRRGSVPDDGWLDRWLSSYPEDKPAVGEQWREVSEESLRGWAEIIDKLLALELTKEADGELRPWFVQLDNDARQAWQRFTEEQAGELNSEDFPEYLRGPWSKLRGYCGRLALIVHELRLAAGDRTSFSVDGESMVRAVRLIHYFKAHARRVYAAMDADPRIDAARRLLNWIARENRTEFKRYEAHNDLKSKARFVTPEDLDKPIDLLTRLGYLRLQEQPVVAGRAGRKPDPVFQVNPLWKPSEESNKSKECPAEGNSSDSSDSFDDSQGEGDGHGDAWEPEEDRMGNH